MTVASTTNKASYNGNGSQSVFAYTFKIFVDADIKVYVGTTLKTINTHYTLSNEILKDYLKYFNININDSFFESHDDAYFFEQIEWSNEDFDVDDILGEINKE